MNHKEMTTILHHIPIPFKSTILINAVAYKDSGDIQNVEISFSDEEYERIKKFITKYDGKYHHTTEPTVEINGVELPIVPGSLKYSIPESDAKNNEISKENAEIFYNDVFLCRDIVDKLMNNGCDLDFRKLSYFLREMADAFDKYDTTGCDAR